MHMRRMQHRDLKPDNVVFDEYCDARVIDLGLAVVVEAKAAVSSAGGANKVGSEAYRSPEKADGKRYDGKDDVWALGCMLGGAVTGKMAEDRCSGRALTRTAAKALVDEAAASVKFGGLVKKMLELNPNARPTAQAVELSLLRGELLSTSSGCPTIVEEEEAIAPVKPSNWTCSVCKRSNSAQTQECGVCGTRKDYPEEKRQREAAAEAERRRRAAEAETNEEKRQRLVAEARAAEAEGKLRAAEARAAEERRQRAAEDEAERQRRARAKAKDEEEKRQRRAKKIDLSKLTLVRTLKGHSRAVRRGVRFSY